MAPLKVLVLAIVSLLVIVLVLWPPFTSEPMRLSGWMAPQADATNVPQPISGMMVARNMPGFLALERYSQGSTLQESVADQRVRFYHRDVAGGGTIAYFVVMLDDLVHLEVINADGATPSSDATGDTIWTDGQKHLATLEDMVRAPYAARDKMTLLGAIDFGFHGDVRTSDEGSVVINGVVRRVNPGRASVCITSDGHAKIGLFDAAALQNCQQAIGAGPVVLWKGKIANTQVTTETDEFVPFNPLHEDFTQLDWRKKIYNGTYPKTVIGVGTRADGRSYLVMLVSYGVRGVDVARELREMGCTDALGGDDDTSTQAIWRGVPVRTNRVQKVPDALAIYLRE